jgi:hypothetical protein
MGAPSVRTKCYRGRAAAIALSTLASLFGAPTWAQDSLTSFTIARLSHPIAITGKLSDPGWKDATVLNRFIEIWPGDGVPPRVRTVVYLAYDDRFFYVAFDCKDPDPRRIRAPYGARDQIGLDQDFVDIVLDTRNDGRTGAMFAVNARGIQSDGIYDDANGQYGSEDLSEDFFFDSAAAINAGGYVVEMRIPFSSLRYTHSEPQTWGIILRRNWNRGRQYRLVNEGSPWPHGTNCFICHAAKLTGLTGLPQGQHFVAAPYGAAKRQATPLAQRLVDGKLKPTAGLDFKWVPTVNAALDATINPDFSQIESDVAQISANERFALSYPEKRPFFLEGSELFTTPIAAVYTRSITAPRWGGRATGRQDDSGYTLLVTEDRGGGTAILPGPNGSDVVPQDFSSLVTIGRLRHDLGKGFASVLLTDREVDGGGYNRVIGPDFQWRPSDRDVVTGQFLVSDTREPVRPDLTPSWLGQRLTSHAGDLWWYHSTRTVDWYGEVRDFGDGFRADDGFVPQVGYREVSTQTGYTFWHADQSITRHRVFANTDFVRTISGAELSRTLALGTGLDGPADSFLQLRYSFDRARAKELVLPRQRILWILQLRPSRLFPWIDIEGNFGQQIDFINARRGRGGDVTVVTTLRPSDRVQLDFSGDRRWLDVPTRNRDARLFTAKVERLKVTYFFSARALLRLIGQYIDTRTNSTLYAVPAPIAARTGASVGSILFSFKVNWQSEVLVGYEDDRGLNATGQLLPQGRQLFLKLSYAFQH